MRMRRKKNLDARMENCRHILIKNHTEMAGRWSTLHPSQASDIYLELGCGKGMFIRKTAQEHPENLYIAAEIFDNVLLTAMEAAIAEHVDNLCFLSENAANLKDSFVPGEVAGIYLNFSDPWPRKKQWKRRLTHENMLTIYKKILREGGYINMKTDNTDLFEFSLSSFSKSGFILETVCLDLEKSDISNIKTEYETRFSQMGMPIYFCRAVKK